MIQKMISFLHRFNIDYFFKPPTSTKLAYLWVVIFLGVLLIDLVIYFIYKRRARRETPYKAYCLKLLITEIPAAAFGLLFCLTRYEHLAPFSYRFWLYLMLVAVIASEAWLFTQRKVLSEQLIRFRSNERKKKWLKENKKKQK
jgi:cbb3-type cytochrome oxidase subunit 3